MACEGQLRIKRQSQEQLPASVRGMQRTGEGQCRLPSSEALVRVLGEPCALDCIYSPDHSSSRLPRAVTEKVKCTVRTQM